MYNFDDIRSGLLSNVCRTLDEVQHDNSPEAREHSSLQRQRRRWGSKNGGAHGYKVTDAKNEYMRMRTSVFGKGRHRDSKSCPPKPSQTSKFNSISF